MKKLITTTVVSLAALLAMTGAEAVVSTDRLEAVHSDVTEQQVVTTLGKPDSVTHWSNGTHSLVYDLKNDAQEDAYLDISDASGKLVARTIIRKD